MLQPVMNQHYYSSVTAFNFIDRVAACEDLAIKADESVELGDGPGE